MKYELLPAEVREALNKRECSEAAISRMSAEDVFREFCLWEGLLGSWSSVLWRITARLRESDVSDELARLEAEKQNLVSERDEALKFVEQVANLDIWDFDKDDGTPYQECDEPSEGHLDSHCCLMQLIEQARQVR